jgi:hypothetical protein
MLNDLKTYKGFKVGDRVRVVVEEPAYDVGTITTTDMGTIKAFPPKVRIIKRPPTMDGLTYFAYIEFDRVIDTIHNNKVRGGVDICNLKKIK